MHTVTVSTHLLATPEQVWSMIGDPGTISSWHPAVAESSLDDGRRQCTLADGAEIDEQVDDIDAAARSYSYRILASPLPVEDYRSTIQVVDTDGGCCVEWSARFEIPEAPAEEVVGAIKGIYDAGMAALRESFNS